MQPPASVHPGLWLGRFLDLQTWHHDRVPVGYRKPDAQSARDELLAQIEKKPLPEGYAEAFAAWRDGFSPERSPTVLAASQGRVIVGLGAKGATDIGVTLHHTWGVPVLPGSSLKGIAALGAREHFADPDAWSPLFGDVQEQGAVLFHDAWLDPRTGHNGLHRDVITVHHQRYYQGEEEPADTDNPNPVPFLSASGSFLVVLELAPGVDPVEHGPWLAGAWRALQLGLQRHGVGAKTNAGYGRFTLPDLAQTAFGARLKTLDDERGAREREQAARRAVEETRTRREALAGADAHVADVARAEGLPALRRWLATGASDPPLVGIPSDAEHIRAAARTLRDAGLAKGLVDASHGPWRAWVTEGLAPPPPPPTPLAPRRPAGPDELDRVIAKNTDRKGHLDGDAAARSLVRARLDATSLAAAVARLRALAARDGHLKALLTDLEAAERGD